MSDDPTIEEIVQNLTDEGLTESERLNAEERLRRNRQRRRWVCMNPQGCGNTMNYIYMMEPTEGAPYNSEFDQQGCSVCGHPQAVEIREAKTE